MMNVGSLFSGIGGIELGFERAGGFKTLWFIENDLHAQTLLRKHWPEAQVYGDITQIDFGAVPKVDILTGGFPCQDISNAGKRIGISGSRSGLWKYYLKAIRILRPRYVVAENVSALLDRGLNVVLADLAEVGYDAEWHCISAASIGAPHRRDRIIIIAYPSSGRKYGEQCQESICQEGRFDELADSDNSRCVYGQAQEQSAEAREYAQRELISGSSDVAYTYEWRSQEGDESEYNLLEEWKVYQNQQYFWKAVWSKSRECCNEISRRQWAVEPDVGRVADGVPLRVDRIKRLGNAVVPQLAEVIAKAIKENESIEVPGGRD